MGVTFTLPNIGLYEKMAALSEVLLSAPGEVGLFQNNHTVADTTTLGSLTPASFSGYSLSPVTSAVPNGGSSQTVASVSLGAVTFTSTSTVAQTIYGAYVSLSTPSAGSDLVVVCNLEGGPQVLNAPGANIVVQCTITDQRAVGQP